jgi:hypothetical protein
MARKARAVLADMRAMEEQGERTNPVNPKDEIGEAFTGKGAVPSMGLSQFRGGKAKDCEMDCEGAGKMLAEQLHKMHGGAYMEKFMRGMGRAMLGEDGHGVRKGGVNTGKYEGEGVTSPNVGAGMSGRGKLEITHHVGGRVIGAGMNVSGPGYEAVSGGKKKRAPAAPSDARRKRGAMVSKLMREEGMTLGEASKHIKMHGME